MDREQFFELHEALCKEAHELMKKKNADYSKDGPFDNLKVCEALKITSAECGTLVRMGDKLSRLASVLQKGQKVEESIKDTCLDLINYSVLIIGMQEERASKMGMDKIVPVTSKRIAIETRGKA